MGNLFKITGNPMHPRSSALPLCYVLACVTLGAFVVDMHSFTPTCCRTSHCAREPLCSSQYLYGRSPSPCVQLCGLVGIYNRANAFLFAESAFFLSYYLLFSFHGLVVWTPGRWRILYRCRLGLSGNSSTASINSNPDGQ